MKSNLGESRQYTEKLNFTDGCGRLTHRLNIHQLEMAVIKTAAPHRDPLAHLLNQQQHTLNIKNVLSGHLSFLCEWGWGGVGGGRVGVWVWGGYTVNGFKRKLFCPTGEWIGDAVPEHNVLAGVPKRSLSQYVMKWIFFRMTQVKSNEMQTSDYTRLKSDWVHFSENH